MAFIVCAQVINIYLPLSLSSWPLLLSPATHLIFPFSLVTIFTLLVTFTFFVIFSPDFSLRMQSVCWIWTLTILCPSVPAINNEVLPYSHNLLTPFKLSLSSWKLHLHFHFLHCSAQSASWTWSGVLCRIYSASFSLSFSTAASSQASCIFLSLSRCATFYWPVIPQPWLLWAFRGEVINWQSFVHIQAMIKGKTPLKNGGPT